MKRIDKCYFDQPAMFGQEDGRQNYRHQADESFGEKAKNKPLSELKSEQQKHCPCGKEIDSDQEHCFGCWRSINGPWF